MGFLFFKFLKSVSPLNSEQNKRAVKCTNTEHICDQTPPWALHFALSGARSVNDGHDRQERIKQTYARKGAQQRRLELQKYNYVVTQFSHACS